jgi:hypothetical protein
MSTLLLTNPKADVRVIDDGGSMVGFRTGTDAAGDWFRDNVDAASWQRLGAVLWIDHHYAGQIIKDLADAGLTMEYD